MIKYELIIYGRESDQAFIVEVPELPGCMAAVRPRVLKDTASHIGERRKGTRTKRDGQTYVEAVTNAEVVIFEWIETAQELWRNISTPGGGYFRFMRLQEDEIRGSIDALEGILG